MKRSARLAGLATASVLVGVLGVASRARAWVPLDTCGLVSTHWGVDQVAYRLNSAGTPDLPFATVQSAVAEGWQVWSDPCCSAWQATFGGLTSVTALESSSLHVLSFADDVWPDELGDVGTVIAVTLTEYQNCVLSDADIIYNGVGFVFVDGAPAQGNGADLQSITAHEVGHWLGLDHPPVVDATMFDTYDGGVGARTLHQDDIDGVCALYPQVEAACVDGTDDDCDGPRDCLDDDCLLVPSCACVPQSALSCGQTVAGTTAGGPSFFDAYACGGAPLGAEVAFSFTPTFDGEVTATLAGMAVDHDLFVLGEACQPSACTDLASTAGAADESLTTGVEFGSTYFFAVDAVGTAGAFELTLDCAPQAERDCDNALDDDGDLDQDCDDADCDGEPCGPGSLCNGPVCECPFGEAQEATCDDREDNDCDGLVDCGDPTCDAAVCAVGRTCASGVCGCAGGEPTEFSCADADDNDCDGDVDCADDDCLDATCGPAGMLCLFAAGGGQCVCPSGNAELVCDDGLDDDCDGAIDCDDPQCNGDACGDRLVCTAGVCTCEPQAALEAECYDGFDDDCDALLDCDDPECAGTDELVCDDTLDDDCDGAADCADSDCESLAYCLGVELECGDAADDDRDGDVDCDDADCASQVECATPGGDADLPGGDADSGGDSDLSGDADPPPGGCGCGGSSGGGALWAIGSVLAALVRRRRVRAGSGARAATAGG